MRVLVDFHHSSLLRSLVMLFQDRLGMEVYRPIGMEWWYKGFWAINDQSATARQFLEIDGAQPIDGTPKLNNWQKTVDWNTYKIADPGGESHHMACTLEYFQQVKFDYVIATIPAHVPLFRELINRYQPQAKLIIQMGNNWDLDKYPGEAVLASVAPQETSANAMFYHQEFDLDIFKPSTIRSTNRIYSFLNVIQATSAWHDYTLLKEALEPQGFELRSYGGQCPDGNMTGPHELAEAMKDAAIIFHIKPGGDGFGHIIHNAYAVGRPVITRASHYKGQLAEKLLVPGTFIDADQYSASELAQEIIKLRDNPMALEAMGRKAANVFKQVVDYNKEAEEVRSWLEKL